MRKFNKLFGIGISRTGTTSLTAALEYVGVRTIHWPTNMLEFCKYRGATDITVACRFKVLDQLFPNSLFIYTEREEKGWLRSVTAHYAKADPTRVLPNGAKQFAQEADVIIYGKLGPKHCDYLKCYETHHREVMEYFCDRPGHLLRMDVSKDDGWTNLCTFLDIPAPEIRFPHHNRRYS